MTQQEAREYVERELLKSSNMQFEATDELMWVSVPVFVKVVENIKELMVDMHMEIQELKEKLNEK